jgi:hypothetical protein
MATITTYIKVAQKGYDAATDPVEDMLIDSNYQTMLVAFQGNGSVTYSSSPQTSTPIGSSLGFIPSIVFITQGGLNGGNLPSGTYSYEAEDPIAGIAYGLFSGDPWTYWYSVSSGTYNYMYYVYYLPSQDPSSTASNPPPNKPPYINVGNIFNPVTTSSFENLSFSSQAQSMQILSQQTFTASATIAAGGTNTFTFAHGLKEVTPFVGTLQNYSTFGFTSNLEAVTCGLDLPIKYNRDEIGVDNTNLYYYYVNNDSSNSHSVDFTITVYFFIPPTNVTPL